MNRKYFDENGRELVLGSPELQNAADAAYSTDDPKDPIFRKIASNKMVKIVDGQVTYVDRPVSQADLYRLNKQQRETRMKVGLTVTGTFKKAGQPIANSTQNIGISERIKTDTMGILIAFTVLGSTDPVELHVSQNMSIVFSEAAQVAVFFQAGFSLIQKIYAAEDHCKDLIKNSTDNVATRKAIREHWATVAETVTVPQA